MSRIGYNPIQIPDGVEVTSADGGDFGNKMITVKGPKGELFLSVRPGITVKKDGSELNFGRENDLKQTKSYHGLYRSLVNNMIKGVTKGFEKELEIVGIGYRAEQQGNKVVFSVGYSHKIDFEPPEGIMVTVNEQTNVKVEGVDKQLVGEVASKIRSFRPPEPYKGKGIRYKGEQIRRKSAKAAATAA